MKYFKFLKVIPSLFSGQASSPSQANPQGAAPAKGGSNGGNSESSAGAPGSAADQGNKFPWTP